MENIRRRAYFRRRIATLAVSLRSQNRPPRRLADSQETQLRAQLNNNSDIMIFLLLHYLTGRDGGDTAIAANSDLWLE
jgi:hypothetical protein